MIDPINHGPSRKNLVASARDTLLSIEAGRRVPSLLQRAFCLFPFKRANGHDQNNNSPDD
jgi:hypothetical protein